MGDVLESGGSMTDQEALLHDIFNYANWTAKSEFEPPPPRAEIEHTFYPADWRDAIRKLGNMKDTGRGWFRGLHFYARSTQGGRDYVLVVTKNKLGEEG